MIDVVEHGNSQLRSQCWALCSGIEDPESSFLLGCWSLHGAYDTRFESWIATGSDVMESRLTSVRTEDITTDNYANCLRVSTGYGFPGGQVSLGAQLGLVGRVTTTRPSRYVLWSACQSDVGRLNGFCYWMLCCGSCDPRVVQGKLLRENDVTSHWTTSGRMLELLGARRAQLIRLTTRRSAVNASRQSLRDRLQKQQRQQLW